MVAPGGKFTRKKEAAITALLTHRSIEEAAKSIGIGAQTLLRWMKITEFQVAFREARRAAFGQSVMRLQQASSAAVTTLLKIAVDANAPAAVKARAAYYILTLGTKAFETEDIEARVTELERAAADAKSNGRR